MDKTDPACLLRLLVHEGLRTGRFDFDEKNRKLWLVRAFDNRRITPIIFRTELQDFMVEIKKTETLWDTSKWPTRPIVHPIPAGAAPLLGQSGPFNPS